MVIIRSITALNNNGGDFRFVKAGEPFNRNIAAAYFTSQGNRVTRLPMRCCCKKARSRIETKQNLQFHEVTASKIVCNPKFIILNFSGKILNSY
jgi:hypothetical protein